MLAQPETNEATIQIIASGMLRRALVAAALVALAVLFLGAAGCSGAGRREKEVALAVESVPPGARIAASVAGGSTERPLGTAPLVQKLKVVRKVYPSGGVDYWLLDGAGVLPPNVEKPDYASSEYAAGNDYPLVLRLSASWPGSGTATTTLRVDRAALRRLFEVDPTLAATVAIDPARRSPPAEGPQASAQATVPRR